MSVLPIANNFVGKRDRKLDLMDSVNHIVVLGNDMGPPLLGQDDLPP